MVKQTAGRDKLGEFAPKFAEINDDVLFGEVWSREDKLSLRDRSMQDGQKLGQLSIWQKRFGQKNKEQLHIYFSCDTINSVILNLNFYKGKYYEKD